MKKRWFIIVDGFEEYVWPLSEFEQRIAEGEADEFILEEAKRDIGGPMYCPLYDNFPETKWDCGKWNCPDYKPCNGKSGRCRELKNGFVGIGKMFKLTKDGLTEVSNE